MAELADLLRGWYSGIPTYPSAPRVAAASPGGPPVPAAWGVPGTVIFAPDSDLATGKATGNLAEDCAADIAEHATRKGPRHTARDGPANIAGYRGPLTADEGVVTLADRSRLQLRPSTARRKSWISPRPPC